jgi:hypothetical protein
MNRALAAALALPMMLGALPPLPRKARRPYDPRDAIGHHEAMARAEAKRARKRARRLAEAR